jgi:hypothetical protein
MLATSAAVRFGAAKPAARVLCHHCSAAAHGVTGLTRAQEAGIAQSGAVVVVRFSSATLRGRVKVFARIIGSTGEPPPAS